MKHRKKQTSLAREQYKRTVQFFENVILLGLLTLEFANVWYNEYSDMIILPFFRRGNWVVVGIYAVMLYLFFKVYGGFKVGYLRRTDVVISQLISLVGTNFIAYCEISVIARNFARPSPVIFLTLIEIVILLCWTFLTSKLYFLLYPPRQLIIIHGTAAAAELVMKMSGRVDKYMICKAISADKGYETIIEKIPDYDGVIISDIPAQMRNDLVKFCYDNKIRAYISPKISDIILRGADDIRLFDSPLLLCRNYGLTFEQRLSKRIFDLLFAIIALVPCLPIMLFCAIAIKLYDGGNIFYKQKRLTIGGREFEVYKFRSMIPNAEADGIQVSRSNDSRVTLPGRLMRKCRFDEFPQLFNILKGDMSVVGPRPERPELCEEYEKQFPEFRFRLHVKAGLTGYAQVTGAYDTQPYDKLKMDLMYIEKYSLLQDIQIILMTLKIIFFPPKNNSDLYDLSNPHLPTETEEEE